MQPMHITCRFLSLNCWGKLNKSEETGAGFWWRAYLVRQANKDNRLCRDITITLRLCFTSLCVINTSRIPTYIFPMCSSFRLQRLDRKAFPHVYFAAFDIFSRYIDLPDSINLNANEDQYFSILGFVCRFG